MLSARRRMSHPPGAGRVFDIADIPERPAEFLICDVALPGRKPEAAGVLLLDRDQDRLHIKLRRDWDEIATEEDVEVLSQLESDLELKAQEMGGGALLSWLEENASQTIRAHDREPVAVRNFPSTLKRLYRQYVRETVHPFKTHLPVYTLEVAAGPFLTNPADVDPEEWVEAPGDLRLDQNFFVARIRGQSMEPRIPDGSLCVFRKGVVGSRNGRLVLVRNSELADENRFTVKRYVSYKDESGDAFRHTRIRLESLNPESPSWDLDPDEEKYEIVAEFVTVLDEE
jgi:phage repressor protein C with HTH and peptisase S24 domain